TQVRDGVPLETVRPALENDELGRELFQVSNHLRPRGPKCNVVRPRRHRHIQFRAESGSLPSLRIPTSSRIQVPSVLVQIGKNDARVLLKRIEHTVPVVRINVDISNAREAKGAPQNLNRHPTVIEHANPGSTVTRSMMKAGNRDKRPPTLS